MKFLAILAILAVAVGQLAFAAPADKIDCSKVEEVLDDLGAAQGFSTLNDKYKLPQTEAEFTKKCEQMTEAIQTLRKYNKECYSSLTQQVFSAILRTRSQMNDVRCKTKFQETLESLKCIANDALEAVKAAEKKTILSSQVLFDSNISNDNLRTRRACCDVIASKGYFMDATKDKCSKYEKSYSDYVDSYTSEAMGLICQDPDKLECDKLEPLKLEGVQTKNTFFLNPMLKIVKTLDH